MRECVCAYFLHDGFKAAIFIGIKNCKLIVTTFRGTNECVLIVNMCVILCPTPCIEGARGGLNQY